MLESVQSQNPSASAARGVLYFDFTATRFDLEAQGNALGTFEVVGVGFRPEGATQVSPGQRPGKDDANYPRTLKGYGKGFTSRSENAMSQSLSKVLIHLVFSTKHRRPMLPHEPLDELHKYARGIFKDRKCHMIEMNNVADHVHIMFDLHRTACISDVVMHVKKGTSRWLKEQAPQFAAFDWQDGYGPFSLGLTQRDDGLVYIRNQQERHRTRSFQEEFREFLQRYEVEYDERYVWD